MLDTDKAGLDIFLEVGWWAENKVLRKYYTITKRELYGRWVTHHKFFKSRPSHLTLQTTRVS